MHEHYAKSRTPLNFQYPGGCAVHAMQSCLRLLDTQLLTLSCHPPRSPQAHQRLWCPERHQHARREWCVGGWRNGGVCSRVGSFVSGQHFQFFYLCTAYMVPCLTSDDCLCTPRNACSHDALPEADQGVSVYVGLCTCMVSSHKRYGDVAMMCYQQLPGMYLFCGPVYVHGVIPDALCPSSSCACSLIMRN